MGLTPDDTAQRSGLTDRSPGVRAECQRHEPGRHRRRRPSARAPGHPGVVVGVAGRTEPRALRRAAHGELVHVGLAHDHRPRLAQPGHDRGVVGRPPAGEDPGPARGLQPPCAQVVLEGDGHAGQRTGVAARGNGRVDRVRAPAWPPRRRRSRTRAPDRRRRTPPPVPARAPRQPSARRSGRHEPRWRCSGVSPSRVAPTGVGHGTSPTIRGTRNRPSSTSGATASTSSRSRHGVASSGRRTLRSGRGWAVGRHVGQVEGGHVRRVVEHRGQLGGEALELVLAQLEASQPGHVGHVVAPDRRPLGGAAHPATPPSTLEAKATVRASTSSRS